MIWSETLCPEGLAGTKRRRKNQFFTVWQSWRDAESAGSNEHFLTIKTRYIIIIYHYLKTRYNPLIAPTKGSWRNISSKCFLFFLFWETYDCVWIASTQLDYRANLPARHCWDDLHFTILDHRESSYKKQQQSSY